MPLTDIEEIFLESASEVLETMFFTGVEAAIPFAEAAGSPHSPLLSAELAFRGSVSGTFGVRVSLQSARMIAANFLGSEETSDSQAAEVVCELSNMLCGSVLSRLEGDARFELEHPELDPANTDWRTYQDAVGRTFATQEGALTMWIVFDAPDWARPAA
jgi:CheY-specific phosphatase CheX